MMHFIWLHERWDGGTIELLAKSSQHKSVMTNMLYVEGLDAQHKYTHIYNKYLNKIFIFKPTIVKKRTLKLQLKIISFALQECEGYPLDFCEPETLNICICSTYIWNMRTQTYFNGG